MEIRTISTILYGKYFCMKGNVIFNADGLTKQDVHLVFSNYVILTQDSVPPERHKLSIGTLNC